MILIAGGTGLLGTQVVRLLTTDRPPVRVLTRDPRTATRLSSENVEIVTGAVQDGAAIARAVEGVRVVISAIQGFSGKGVSSPRTVDLQGNSALIQAARQSGVERFILMSIHGAAPDHPIELFRMKYHAEQELKASGLSWTIIRPTAYMETWVKLVEEPLLKTGKTRIFGRGENPINFVSVYDVAQFVASAAQGTSMQGEYVEVGGPENLTMRQVAQTVMRMAKVSGTLNAVPLPMMRVMAPLLRPLNTTLARQILAAIVMDTEDMSFNSSEMRRRYPLMPYTSLEDVVRRGMGAAV